MDVTDISSSWENQSDTLKQLREQVSTDITSLEAIIGAELTIDDLREVASFKPNVLIIIVYKIFDMLRFFCRFPVMGEDGQMTTINVYQKMFEAFMFKAREGNNGQLPQWMKSANAILAFGMKMAESVDSEQSK